MTPANYEIHYYCSMCIKWYKKDKIKNKKCPKCNRTLRGIPRNRKLKRKYMVIEDV